jgi:uncharacterized membrane protein YdjX (TVP38/TMEM64 family)
MTSAARSPPRHWRRKHLLLAAGLAALIVVLALLTLHAGFGEVVDATVLRLRAAGPVAFFLAMAVLPAVGFPMLAFTLAAGPVFGPTMGSGWVIVWSLAAVVANLLLTYWLADRALRPLVSRLVTYFEFRLPENLADNAWQLALIVRLTPGPPFWVQSYLLGVLRLPLVPYLVVSTAVMAGYIVALVFGGEAIVEGNGSLAVAALGAMAIFVAALQLLRKRTARRRAVAALPVGLQPIVAAK